jgi:hypothetical protein
MLRYRLIVALAATALAGLASTAHAGQRFSLGTGKSPHVLVEPDTGTAHVVWLDGNDVKTCNVPRGATSCTPQTVAFPFPDSFGPDKPWMVRGGDGTLYIYMGRYVAGGTTGDAWLARSTDGGQTWSAASRIYFGVHTVGTDKTEPVLFPGGQVTQASFNGGGNVFAAALDGSEGTGNHPVAELQNFGTSFKYDIQAVPTADGGMIAVAHDTPAYFWTMAPGLDPSLTASWSAPAQFAAEADESRVASGSSGTYALTVEPGGTFRHVLIRKLGAGGFGIPVEAESQQGYITDLTEGPSGTAAGVWRTNGSDPDNRLRFSTSKDGSAFTTVTIARGGEVFADLDVSIAADDKGFAVWEDGSNGVSIASTDAIVDENAPPGTGTTVVEYANGTITLGGVKGCVNPGGKTTVRLGFKRKKRKGNVWIKVFRVDFSQDGKLLKKVKKPPFKRTIKVKATQPKGSFIEIRARAFIKVHKGRTPKKSVRVRIPVCP